MTVSPLKASSREDYSLYQMEVITVVSSEKMHARTGFIPKEEYLILQ